jgi:hypothetical protein
VNYDLAMMALEGMARAPMSLVAADGEVVLQGDAASFKELARLCLLLGGTNSTADEFALTPGVHITGESPLLRLRLTST